MKIIELNLCSQYDYGRHFILCAVTVLDAFIVVSWPKYNPGKWSVRVGFGYKYAWAWGPGA